MATVLLAVASITSMSAFTQTGKENESHKLGAFYKYKLTTYTESQIKLASNYERAEESCSGIQNVCGVYLDTDNGISSQPDVSEFNDIKNDLWLSQQAHSPASSEIAMRN
ncbi:hypothetical protein ACFOWC_02565 [Pedobacter mendelii]